MQESKESNSKIYGMRKCSRSRPLRDTARSETERCGCHHAATEMSRKAGKGSQAILHELARILPKLPGRKKEQDRAKKIGMR